MTITDLIQAISMVVLVIITGIYAWGTYVISKATKEQAEASVKMAEEMKEQRLSEAQPYLLLRLKDRLVQWDGISPDYTFTITIINAGKGPAIDLYTALWNKGEKRYVPHSQNYLIHGEEWQAEVSRYTQLTGK